MGRPKGLDYSKNSYCRACGKVRPKEIYCPICHRRMRQKPHDKKRL